jgi:hypothetical protein
MLLISLPLCAWVLWTIRESNYEVEGTIPVEGVAEEKIEVIAMPKDHEAGYTQDDAQKNEDAVV